MLLIELQKITKDYNGHIIFSDICETLREGSCLVITGPNGSGKTTLLKILAGLIRPASGKFTISVDGTLLADENRKDYLGFVSPDLYLYEELTALENLEFFVKVRGLAESEEYCLKLLKKVQLDKWGGSLVGTYSTGMKQRLKFAYALLHQPLLLLLDEPGANLDEEGQALVQEIISQQKETGAVILSTNDPAEVARYGDQVLKLDEASRGFIK